MDLVIKILFTQILCTFCIVHVYKD